MWYLCVQKEQQKQQYYEHSLTQSTLQSGGKFQQARGGSRKFGYVQV